jgi:hypothetical protein
MDNWWVSLKDENIQLTLTILTSFELELVTFELSLWVEAVLPF